MNNMKDNIELLSKEIYKDDIEYPLIVRYFARILDDKLPTKFKLHLSYYYIVFLMSQFRIPINLGNDNLITINSISFLFAPSGMGKDSSVNALNRCMAKALNMIESRRNDEFIRKQEMNENLPKEQRSTILPPPTLEVGISTPEGLMQHLEDLNRYKLGSCGIYSGEIFQEMTNSVNSQGILQVIAELYDVGKKSMKVIKDKSNQTGRISKTSLSALFIAPFSENIYNNNLRSKLKNEFTSRFGRRSSVTLIKDELPTEKIENLSEWIQSSKTRLKEKEEIYYATERGLAKKVEDILNSNLTEIKLDDEALETYIIYKELCYLKSTNYIANTEAILKANTCHLAFQALKLAGALSLCKKDNKAVIDKQLYLESIKLIEFLNEDMKLLNNELNKNNYDILIDYCKLLLKNENKAIIPISILTKLDVITSNNLNSQLTNILRLCNSSDKNSFYSIDNDNVIVLKTNSIDINSIYKASYLPLDGDKEDRNKKCAEGYKFNEYTFDELEVLLNTDCAYSPFEFKNGKRNKENLINSISFVALDVDKADLDIQTLHNYLKGVYNHYIATTSNKENLYKYRILLPLSNIISIDEIIWKKVIKEISNILTVDINLDYLPQSQIFYGYKDSIIYKTTDKTNIDIKSIVERVKEKIEKPKPKDDKSLKKERNDFRNTFSYAFNSTEGQRHLNMIRAINHLIKDLGGTKEEAYSLVNIINEEINPSLSQKDLERTIYPHIEKVSIDERKSLF